VAAVAALAAAAVLLPFAPDALACPRCYTGGVARAMAFGPSFWGNLSTIALPFILLGVFAIARPAKPAAPARRLIRAGVLLGIGLGGFIDGILLHQILQWHNMLSSRVAPTDLVAMKYNMVWDGLFHAFTWIVTAIGIGMLWHAGSRKSGPWSARTFVGALLGGWGLFNLVEGVVDHQMLGVHHVHPGVNEVAWDVGFLVFGAALVFAGAMLAREEWT
jgi:uncharacterized membrane protein